MELAGAAAAMRDRAYLEQLCQRVSATRAACTEQLRTLGFSVLPSTANFVLASPPNGKAEAWYLALKSRGILVRYFKKPRLEAYLRITIGTDAEMASFIEQVKAILLEQ